MFHISRSACAGLIVAAGLLSAACVAHVQEATAVPRIAQRSAQTRDGVAVLDADDNPILVPGAGGNPQEAPGVG